MRRICYPRWPSYKKFSIPLMNFKSGDIWLADLGLTAKTRPVLIVFRHDPEAPRALITYVPPTPNTEAVAMKCPWDTSRFCNNLPLSTSKGSGLWSNHG